MAFELDPEVLALYENFTSNELLQLDDRLRMKIQHARLHAKHKDHDSMHAQMWKQRHFRSYQTATLFWMWLIPIIFSVKRGWWRFCSIWMVFSATTLFIVSKARQKQISGSTPRLIYKWFLLSHKTSYMFGCVGYAVILGSVLGLNVLVNVSFQTGMDFGIVLMFYGLYFGVLNRDFAEICTNTMASHIGYFNRDGLPSRSLEEGVCAVCGNAIVVDNGTTTEKKYRLACSHLFHEYCIRGWCIVGKNEICPYCKEKVDLRQMFQYPWEKPEMMYGKFLDFIRYLVAWQPLIIILVQGVNLFLGLE
uniref:RING-type domain-containing protein n=1 Tax=Trichuris muris TaxID=70415 RepID=A0A5S6QQP6_TRIMR